jgi:hypothetical protein
MVYQKNSGATETHGRYAMHGEQRVLEARGEGKTEQEIQFDRHTL